MRDNRLRRRYPEAMLRIRGATLAGMAAAARLSRLGHDVQLARAGVPMGGPWAPRMGPDGIRVDALPPVFTLPALWRDLFTKTGRPLAGSVGAAGLDLVPTTAAEHRFPDGSSFVLPAGRGPQFYAIRDRWGERAASQWRDLLDSLDDVWTARRRFGVEDTQVPRTKQDLAALGLDRRLQDLADRVDQPHLATILTSWGPRSGTDSPEAPALLALPLVLERTFDRWHLVDRDGLPVAASAMVELLEQRVRQRGVEVLDDVADPDIDCLPQLPRTQLFRRPPRGFLAPTITHRLVDGGTDTSREVVDHTSGKPVVRWYRPTLSGLLETTHDHRHPHEDLARGLAPDDASAWRRRLPVTGDVLSASTASLGGNEPWAELASGALATYALHQHLTGVDPSPRNKQFRPPPLRTQRKPS